MVEQTLQPTTPDDAIMTLLDATPGRSGLFIKQNAQLQSPVENASVIFVRWNGRTKRGDGLVLDFDTEKARELSGAGYENEPFWLCRLKCLTWMADNPDECNDLVKVIHRFEVNGFSEVQKLQSVNCNPLAELGLTNASFVAVETGDMHTEAEAAATPFIPSAACMAIVLVAALLFSRRR